MRRLLWLLLALAGLAAAYRMALSPSESPGAGGAGEKLLESLIESEATGRQLTFELDARRPLALDLEPGTQQVRLVTTLELPAARFRSSDEEYGYRFRVRMLDREGRAVQERDCAERTRKIRVRDSAGAWQENVSFRQTEVLAAEPRTTVADVPASATSLELSWPTQEFRSAAVRAYGQVASELDGQEIVHRWATLSPEARDRLARAHSLGRRDPSMRERAAAVSHPWKRLAPLGNPGHDYQPRYLFQAPQPVAYVPPAARKAGVRGLAMGGPRTAVFNLAGPGTFEATWQALPGPEPATGTAAASIARTGTAAPAHPALFTAALLSETGTATTTLCRLVPVPGAERPAFRGRLAIPPGLHTLELALSSERTGLMTFATDAVEALPFGTAPAPVPGRLGELSAAGRGLRSFEAGPATSAVNPEIEVVPPPGGGAFAVRVTVRRPIPWTPQADGRPAVVATAPKVTLGVELLDSARRATASHTAELSLVAVAGERPVPELPPGAWTATGLTSATVLVPEGTARVRFWASPPAALAFYTRLPASLQVELAEAEERRQSGVERWMVEGPRQWFPVLPANASELEAKARQILTTVPLRALSAGPVMPATAPDDGLESDGIAPLEPLARFRVAEPSARPLPAGKGWERRAFRQLGDAGLELQQTASGPHGVPFQGRLLYLLPTVPGAGAPALAAEAGPIVLGFTHPMTARGELALAGSPFDRFGTEGTRATAHPTGGSALLRLRGAPRGTVALTNLPPAGDPLAPPWRERTYYRLEPGQCFTASIRRDADGRQALNLGLLPIAGTGKAEPLVLTALLEGPAPRQGELLTELTAPERVIRFEATGESPTLFLDRPGPRVGRGWNTALTLQDDRGPGDYRWQLRLTSGQGVLIRAFQMRPARPGEGQLWVSSRL